MKLILLHGNDFMNVKIRKAQISDLDIICEIEKLCFESFERFERNFFHFLISNPKSFFLVASIGDSSNNVVGFIILHRKTSSIYEIYTINVHPNWQRKGIGEKLMRSAEELLLEIKPQPSKILIELIVYDKNTAAIKLYNKMNYIEIDFIHNYYSKNRNGIKMIKELHNDERK